MGATLFLFVLAMRDGFAFAAELDIAQMAVLTSPLAIAGGHKPSGRIVTFIIVVCLFVSKVRLLAAIFPMDVFGSTSYAAAITAEIRFAVSHVGALAMVMMMAEFHIVANILPYIYADRCLPSSSSKRCMAAPFPTPSSAYDGRKIGATSGCVSEWAAGESTATIPLFYRAAE